MKTVESIRCILIDDHEEEHDLFRLGLKASGLPVICHCYFSAGEAYEVLYHRSSPEPKVIFLDVNMPRMNGIEFLQKIKSVEHLKHIPVFVYSLGEFTESKQQALELGAVDYLLKPDTGTELSAMLLTALQPYLPGTGSH
jgi:CheY-like chemotaxis protein